MIGPVKMVQIGGTPGGPPHTFSGKGGHSTRGGEVVG